MNAMTLPDATLTDRADQLMADELPEDAELVAAIREMLGEKWGMDTRQADLHMSERFDYARALGEMGVVV